MMLPDAVENIDRFGFSVQNKGKLKGFCWSWAERIEPKRARVINDKVLAISTPGLAAKEVLLHSDERKFFTEPHYNGFPAILVRLEAIEPDELEDLLIDAWRCKASKATVLEYDSINQTQ